jgi:hypothetical protein
MIEGSGSIPVDPDPDPEGPKTRGSCGSGTLQNTVGIIQTQIKFSNLQATLNPAKSV